MLPLVALLSGAKTLGWDTKELLGNVFKTLVRFWPYRVYVRKETFWKIGQRGFGGKEELLEKQHMVLGNLMDPTFPCNHITLEWDGA
jgi:hypothetical protein